MPHEMGISPLRGDGQNALDLFQSRWNAILHEVHKGLDGRKSDVSRASTISPSCSSLIFSLTSLLLLLTCLHKSRFKPMARFLLPVTMS